MHVFVNVQCSVFSSTLEDKGQPKVGSDEKLDILPWQHQQLKDLELHTIPLTCSWLKREIVAMV